VTPKWIKAYIEAKPHELRNFEARNKKSRTPSFVELPNPAGAASVLRRRRKQKESFRKIRGTLSAAIRQCASGSMGDKAFYKKLNETWGSSGARAQNTRWQATGRKSNFKRLCKGLSAILAAKETERDRVVLETIDSLNKGKPVSTRRALLSELLCHFFPSQYPILDKPVAAYTQQYMRGAYGLSKGAKYIHLATSLRAALKKNPRYPAKDLFELDGLIWEAVPRRGG
jgi:hypothetical protein